MVIVAVIIIMIVTVICIVYQDYARTALMWASNDGRKEMVQLLLDHGADIDMLGVSIIYTTVCIAMCMYGSVYMYEWGYMCLCDQCI